jgi:hypothetical protein
MLHAPKQRAQLLECLLFLYNIIFYLVLHFLCHCFILHLTVDVQNDCSIKMNFQSLCLLNIYIVMMYVHWENGLHGRYERQYINFTALTTHVLLHILNNRTVISLTIFCMSQIYLL